MANAEYEITDTLHAHAEHLHAGAEHAAHDVEHAAHELPNFITLLNENFSGPWIEFLHQWENVFFSLIAAGLVSLLFILGARKSSLIPEGIQNFCEAVTEGLEFFVTGILGEAGKKHIPFLGTIFLYILLMNWSGLIPLMKSPTAAWSTTLAVALVTMVYVQFTGIREQGVFHYLKHMAGNPSNAFGYFLIPLMLVLNIILEIGAVPFSLSLRLFANISSEDRLLLNFAELAVSTKYIAFPFQLFANILAIIFSLVQAFVFMLLSTVYISLVLPHDNHHEHVSETAHAH